MIKTADVEIVLTGDWQEIPIPGAFVFMQFFNTTPNPLEVSLGSTEKYKILQEHDEFQLPARSLHEAYKNTVKIKGTLEEIVMVEIHADETVIDAIQ